MVPMASFSEKNVLEIVFIGLLAYFIGLLWNKVSEFCFSSFRNKKSDIESARKEVYAFHCCTEKAISDGGCKKLFACLRRLFLDEDEKEGSYITDYYKAYYALQKEGMLGNIPILEGQFAFLRNHFLLVPVCIAIYSHKVIELDSAIYNHVFLLTILFILSFFSTLWYLYSRQELRSTREGDVYCIIACFVIWLFFFIVHRVNGLGDICKYIIVCTALTLLVWSIVLYAMKKIQQKIYYLVWEGYLYLSSNKEKK